MITVTESAVRTLRRILDKEGHAGALLRVGVKGGGCSGFSYHMEHADAARDDDHRFEFHGLGVVVDPRSMEFLHGITLDYNDGLNAGFVWRNPNATKSCSCGESFSVS
jgi:iron-sulfur cluster assembly protein